VFSALAIEAWTKRKACVFSLPRALQIFSRSTIEDTIESNVLLLPNLSCHSCHSKPEPRHQSVSVVTNVLGHHCEASTATQIMIVSHSFLGRNNEEKLLYSTRLQMIHWSNTYHWHKSLK